MSEKNIVGRMKYAFSDFNEKICFSKEISSIGSVGTVRLLKGGAAKFLNYIGRCFAYASTRTYGAFMLSFGLVSLFLQFAEFYFKSEPGDAFSYIIISAAVALLGIPLLIFDRPMCIALQDIPITDYLLFEFLSIKRMHRNESIKGLKMILGIFLGFIPAVISFFLPIQYVLLFLILTVIVLVSFTTPEFPMVLTILVLPYVSIIPYAEIVLVCASLIAFASYALKVILGKRVYNFSIYDIIVFILSLVILISGFLGKGDDSIKNSFLLIAVLLIYFPANNLIVNRRLADLSINSIVISSIPVAILSVVEFIVESDVSSYDPPSYATKGISVFFASPESLAAFLLVSAVLALAYSIGKRRMWKKVFYFCVFILEIMILGLMMQPFIWITILLGMPAYFIITSKKIPLDSLIAIILLPFVVFLIPVSFLDKAYAFLKISPSFSGILAAYNEALDVFGENIWFGVGVGDSGYNTVTGSNSGGIFNTPIGVGVELGIFAVILLCLFILIFLRQLSHYRRFMTNSVFVTVKDMSALAIVILFIYGMGNHIFDDMIMFALFIIVFGISNSAMRSARHEHEDRLSYYGDSRSSESSVIDVDIR